MEDDAWFFLVTVGNLIFFVIAFYGSKLLDHLEKKLPKILINILGSFIVVLALAIPWLVTKYFFPYSY